MHMTVRQDGQRASTSNQYLHPYSHRPNLDIRANSARCYLSVESDLERAVLKALGFTARFDTTRSAGD